jgi:hypothetical protein
LAKSKQKNHTQKESHAHSTMHWFACVGGGDEESTKQNGTKEPNSHIEDEGTHEIAEISFADDFSFCRFQVFN